MTAKDLLQMNDQMIAFNALIKGDLAKEVKQAKEALDALGDAQAIAGAQAKAMGVTSGVSDCLFMWKGETYAFEFKTQIGRQSEKQLWWQEQIESNGFKYFIVRNYENFCEIIKAIL